MAKKKRTDDNGATGNSLPDGDPARIVPVCRRFVQEAADHLSPRVYLMMLAIQRAVEATKGHTKTFDLDAIFEQIQKINEGAEEVSAATTAVARRTKPRLKPDSFFTGFISGKKPEEHGTFNVYMRKACTELGLEYEAAIGTLKSGPVLKYIMKRLPSPGVESLKELIREGASLLTTKGWADDEARRSYMAARALEDRLVAKDAIKTPRLRAEVAIGLWSNSLIRGDFAVAKVEAGRLVELADQSGDHDIRIVAYRTLGTNALWLGDFVGAEAHLRKCLDELARGPEYAPFATDLGASPFSFACSDLADALWALGRYEEALEKARLACDQALAKSYYFHYCYSVMFSSWIHFKLGEFEVAANEAATMLEWADRCGLAAFRALGGALEGVIRAFQANDATEGIGRIYEGLGAWRSGSAELLVCYFFTDAAQAWLRCGHAHAAELELEKAIKVAGRTGEGYYKAEMHRLQGDIERLHTKLFAEAELDLRTALEVATTQQSNTFQLRAAVSLLKLARGRTDFHARQKKRQIAEDEQALKAICKSFDGEHDSADLREARILLGKVDGPRQP
jgi:tetratricopeptide (TPR) repeat protein